MEMNYSKNSIDRNPIKLLHLLSYKNKTSPLFENLVIGVDQKKISQTICLLYGYTDELNPLKKLGYNIFCMGLSKKKIRRFRPSVVFQIARIIKEQQIDIVHCQRHKPTVYGTLAAWVVGRNIKVVTTVHGQNRTRNIGRKLLNFILFKKISRIFAVSEAVRQDILKTNRALSGHKVATVYNGIDVKPFTDFTHTRSEAREYLNLPNKDTFIFGTVGRLTKVKGQSLLLKAFAGVCRKDPDSLLVIAGKGPLETDLRSLAAELNIQNRVVFLGYRNDIPCVLRAYDVFVFPSLSEGLPLALMEAMLTGIPVIASKVGGIPEILNDSNLGTMVSPSSVEELTSAMQRVRQMSAAERKKVGKALKDRVMDEFTKEKMVAAMTNEYMEVMNNQATRRADTA